MSFRAAIRRNWRVQQPHVEFGLEHFAFGLANQGVSGIVFAEHVEEQPRRRLQLPRGAPRLRMGGRGQAGNAGDVAESPARQFAGVEARQRLRLSVLRGSARRR